VQKLHLVGFTTDHEGLILSARRGARSGSYLLAIDASLEEAVDELRTRRAEEPEADRPAEAPRRPRVESALSVKEIQARLRTGRSTAEVARAAGVDVEWVDRFAPPVLAERAQVITKVQSVPLRRARLGPSALPIGEAVRHNLADRGVSQTGDEFASAWTARQVADGRWAVRFTFHFRGRDQVLRFDLDEGTGEVSTADRASGQLGYVAPRTTPTVTSVERPRPAKPAPDPRPVAKRAVVSTGFRPERVGKPVSRPAKEREKATVALRKAAAKRAAEAERAASRKARERREAATRLEREEKAAAAQAARDARAARRAAEETARAEAAAAKEAATAREAAADKKAADKKAASTKRAASAKKAAATKKAASAKRAAGTKKAAETTKAAGTKKAADRATGARKRPAAPSGASTSTTRRRASTTSTKRSAAPANAASARKASPARTRTAAKAPSSPRATQATKAAPARTTRSGTATKAAPMAAPATGPSRTTTTAAATPVVPPTAASPATRTPSTAEPSGAQSRPPAIPERWARPGDRVPSIGTTPAPPAAVPADGPETDGARLTGAAANVYGTESARALFRASLVEQVSSGDTPAIADGGSPAEPPANSDGAVARPVARAPERPRRLRPLRAT
jgi:hypothetical protein